MTTMPLIETLPMQYELNFGTSFDFMKLPGPTENTLAKKFFFAQVKLPKKYQYIQFGVHMNSSMAKNVIRFQPSYFNLDSKSFIIGMVKCGLFYTAYMIPSRWIKNNMRVNNASSCGISFATDSVQLQKFYIGIIPLQTQSVNKKLSTEIIKRINAGF